MINTLFSKPLSTFGVTVLFVFLTAQVSLAQFPAHSAAPSPLVGTWQVTNLPNASIQLEIKQEEQFSMSVNDQSSQGQWNVDGKQLTLNFDGGTTQVFDFEYQNGSLIFNTQDGRQAFVMSRVGASNSGPPQGFPIARTNDAPKPAPVSGSKKIQGTWYAKLESKEVSVFVKSVFNPDGTYKTMIVFSAQGQKETQSDTGQWKVQGNKLVSRSSGEQETEAIRFYFEGNNLVLDMTQEFGTKMSMSRESSQVKPTSFDLQRLMQYAQDQEPSVDDYDRDIEAMYRNRGGDQRHQQTLNQIRNGY